MLKVGPLKIVVVGSGVAGLSCALSLAESGHKVVIVTKAKTSDSATFYAQGGIASQWFSDIDDSAQSHIADTLAAGAGLCNSRAVEILVNESKEAISNLLSRGAQFDKLSDGTFARTIEGGHHVPRIIHAGGDKTGQEVERALVDSVASAKDLDITIIDYHLATNLIHRDGKCFGIECINKDGITKQIEANHVVLATGGAGQLFSVTTNPLMATADGVALALNAGVLCTDLEFMQFHPTALHVDNMPRPLLSEALRGAGAILCNSHGESFMAGVHPLADLAPRDVVSRKIKQVLTDTGEQCVYLDARMINDFKARFPTIYSSCDKISLDPAVDFLPVSPAAHYFCGGVMTDLNGATSMRGLWAAGEVACNGVHGANRLASNSLLDGLVFGERVAKSIHNRVSQNVEIDIHSRQVDEYLNPGEIVNPYARQLIQKLMNESVGIVRNVSKLEEIEVDFKTISDLAKTTDNAAAITPFEQIEIANLLRVGQAMAKSALERKESRGCHTMAEYEGPNDELIGRFVNNGSSQPLSFVAS